MGRDDEQIGLADLVLLLLVAGGPSQLGLVDSGGLHRAMVAAHRAGQLTAVAPRLGYQPDPMIGRRVTGLDEALRRLVDDRHLAQAPMARWRITAIAAAAARRHLAALPFEQRRAVHELAASWRALVEQDTERRRRGRRHTSPA